MVEAFKEGDEREHRKRKQHHVVSSFPLASRLRIYAGVKAGKIRCGYKRHILVFMCVVVIRPHISDSFRGVYICPRQIV